LWFLLALVLAVASVAAFFLLFADDHQRLASEQVIERNGNTRDLLQRLLARNMPPQELNEIMQPIVDNARATLSVLDAKGNTLWTLSAKKPEAPPAPVMRELVDRMRDEGPVVNFGVGREVQVALPMTGDAVYYAQTRGPRPQWQDASGWRLVLGLSVILVVGLGLCFFLARSITGPLLTLAQTVERFGSGDLSARAKIGGNDEVKAMGDSFNLMADRITRLLDDRRRLLADISHELKTPLSRLRLSLELARDGSLDFLDRGDKQIEQLSALIDELLLYSRLEAQPYSAVRSQTDISQLVRELAAGDLRVHCAQGPLEFPVDRRLFARALGNVIENALRYAVAKVEVKAASANGTLVVTISDDGPGVSDTDRPRLFEAFFRTDAARSRDAGGHGLGLAIAKRCVEAHGGSVSAEPGAGGQGLCIRFVVPPA
jgi:signal transduction histidine kinase